MTSEFPSHKEFRAMLRADDIGETADQWQEIRSPRVAVFDAVDLQSLPPHKILEAYDGFSQSVDPARSALRLVEIVEEIQQTDLSKLNLMDLNKYRRKTSFSCHPDRFPKELRSEAHRILSDLNARVDAQISKLNKLAEV